MDEIFDKQISLKGDSWDERLDLRVACHGTNSYLPNSSSVFRHELSCSYPIFRIERMPLDVEGNAK